MNHYRATPMDHCFLVITALFFKVYILRVSSTASQQSYDNSFLFDCCMNRDSLREFDNRQPLSYLAMGIMYKIAMSYIVTYPSDCSSSARSL